MKILILSTSHPYKTAGVVAKDIFDGFRKINSNEVKLVVKEWGLYHDKDIVSVDSFFKHISKWLYRKGNNLLRKLRIYRKKALKFNRDYSVQDYDQTTTYYTT